MTASTNDAQMRPASWVCISPHTCIRCTDDVVDQTCIFNKFTCSCLFDEKQNGALCVHRKIIDDYKSKITTMSATVAAAAAAAAPTNNTDPTLVSQPCTSASGNHRKSNRQKLRRRHKLSTQHHHFLPANSNVDLLETKSLLQSPTFTTSTSPFEHCQFETNLASPSDNNFNTRIRTSASSSSSSSSSSNSSDSTTSHSDSSDSSTSSSSSSSSTTSTSTSNAQNDGDSPVGADIVAKVRRRRGYKIMDENEPAEVRCYDGEKSAESSPSVGSDSDGSDSDESTSASSDDSWWQTYERQKDILFLEKNNLMTKDSGYVSTTSPNTDSTKTDE